MAGVTSFYDQIEQLYESGRVFDAYQLGVSTAPLRQWAGPRGRILAGRIAMNLGAPRMGRYFHDRAYREYPIDPEVAGYYGRALLERRGPLAALEFCRTRGDLTEASPRRRADWLAFRANLHAIYRDAETADELIAEAIRLAPDYGWVRVEHASILEQSDRYDQAIEAAHESLRLHPNLRPGIQHLAHLMQVRDRDADALALLTESARHIQSVPLLFQLATLQDHLRMHAAAMATLVRIEQLSPFNEKRHATSMAWLRSNICYHAGDYTAAITAAESTDDDWLNSIGKKLREQVEAGRAKPRVRLTLPFVRQHHMTCAPATLTAVSRYWSRPADHLELTEAICYDGTPSYSQRQWAKSNGWVTREFGLTWETVVTLIDRGVPFTLATVGLANAHLQAVIGYDPMRGTVLCRDPYQYYETEFSVDMLVKYNGAFGPHCMVMLPEAESHRLDGVDLPDSDLLDQMHELERSLAVHDRVSAVAARDRINAASPGHRLALTADRAVASYDRDTQASLTAIEGLLHLFPESQPLQLGRVYDLRTLGRRADLQRELSAACGKKNTDPVFLQLYAEYLRDEAGDTPQVLSLLKRAIRRRPTHPPSLATMGHVLWWQRRRDEATRLYYLTACVDEKNEYPAQIFFNASRGIGETDRALKLLERRFDRFGRQSAQPGITLSWAYEEVDRFQDSLDLLDRAIALRPEDGDLRLTAANNYARRAHFDRARQLLGSAEGKVRKTAWLRTAARIAELDGQPRESLAIWRQVADTEPMAGEAHDALARLIAETDSPDSAVTYLSAVCGRFPHNANLQQSRIIWLRQVGQEAVVSAAAAFVDVRPGDLWARVELSLALGATGRAKEAATHAGEALRIAPNASNAHFAMARAFERLGQIEPARGHFRESIRSSVHYTSGIEALYNSYTDTAGEAEALEFVAGQFKTQRVYGDGLTLFARLAFNVLPAERIEQVLVEANAARPDVWQTWSALTRCYCDSHRLDDADRVARESTDRFPLLPRMEFDLAVVCSLRADRDGEIAALRRCLNLSPGWSAASRRLARAVQLAGKLDDALAVMRKAVARDPLDGENHEDLARLLWAADDRPAAVASGRRAVELNPWLTDMWSSLEYWGRQTRDPDAIVKLARDVAARRSGEAVSWTILARTLQGKETLQERLQACDRAITLSPTHSQSYDLKATILVEASRFDEAIEICNPPAYQGRVPMELRGRAAWVLDAKKERPAAIDAMRAVLAENPGYYWGWRQLVKWVSEAGDASAYLGEAVKMVDRFPNDAVARNNLAHAQLAVKDRASARKTLEGTLTLFPDDAYVLEKLFSLQVDAADWEPAHKTLDLMRLHLQPESMLASAVELAARSGDRAGAGTAFLQLCLLHDARYAGSVTDSIEQLRKASMGKVIDATLVKACEQTSGVRVTAVEQLAARLGKQKKWRQVRKLVSSFPEHSDRWRAATIKLVEGLAEQNRPVTLLRLIRKNEKAYRLDTRLWGAVTYALLTAKRHHRLARWASDWKSQKDARDWMLLNVVTANRRSGLDRTAAEVGRHAVTLGQSETTLKHQFWLAIDEALAGTRGPATEAVFKAETAKLPSTYAYLNRVIRALETVRDGSSTDAGRKALAAKQELRAAYGKVRKWNQAELTRVYIRALGRIRRQSPNPIVRAFSSLGRLIGR